MKGEEKRKYPTVESFSNRTAILDLWICARAVERMKFVATLGDW